MDISTDGAAVGMTGLRRGLQSPRSAVQVGSERVRRVSFEGRRGKVREWIRALRRIVAATNETRHSGRDRMDA
jgi:hypothetical protein